MKLEMKRTGTLFERDLGSGPAPNQYRPEDATAQKPKAPALSMSFRFNSKGKEKAPGPQTYRPNPQMCEKNEPKQSILTRNGNNFILQAIKRSGKPCPADIDLRPKSALQIGRAQSMSFRFKKDLQEKQPGPADYKVEQADKLTQDSKPAFTLKVCKTLASEEAKRMVKAPAPNQYNTDTNGLNKSGAGRFAVSYTKNKAQGAGGPGPQSYKGDFKATKPRPQSASFGFRYSKVWTF